MILPHTEIASTSPVPFSAEAGLAVTGRLFLAIIFILSSLSKLTDPTASIGYITSVGLAFPELALLVAIAVELVGGVLLVLGYRVRAVALALAAFTLVTAFSFHFKLADQNQFIHFFKNIAMTGGLLQIAAFGGGHYSLSRR